MKKFRSMREYNAKHYGEVAQRDGSYINQYGSVSWYNAAGDFHRQDGPATLLESEKMFSWWLNGEYYTFESWCKKLNKSGNELTLLQAAYADAD
jgi:hypothetical protein